MNDADAETVTRIDRLITMCEDRASALRAAADGMDDVDLTRRLRLRAERWVHLENELRSAVRALGGTPGGGRTVLGALHRTWIYIKAAANEYDTIRRECARREAAAVRKLKQEGREALPSRVQAVVEEFLGGLSDCDEQR